MKADEVPPSKRKTDPTGQRAPDAAGYRQLPLPGGRQAEALEAARERAWAPTPAEAFQFTEHLLGTLTAVKRPIAFTIRNGEYVCYVGESQGTGPNPDIALTRAAGAYHSATLYGGSA